MEELDVRVDGLSVTPSVGESGDAISAMHDALQRRQQQAHSDAQHARALADKQRQLYPEPTPKTGMPAMPASTMPSIASVPSVPSKPTMQTAQPMQRSPSSATKTSAVSLHSLPLVPPGPGTPLAPPPQSPRSMSLLVSPMHSPSDGPSPWGTLTPDQVQYEQIVSPSLASDALPSLVVLRSKLVRLYPQLGTRAMVGLQGSAPSVSPGGGAVYPPGVRLTSEGVRLDEESFPLSLWRAEEPGSAAGDSVGALFPPDERGHVPSSAAALYVRAEGIALPSFPEGNKWGSELYGDAWPAVKQEATDPVRGYPLTEKQRRRVLDKLAQREKDLVLEATSKQDRAEVLLTVYTEQREGYWRVRRPVKVGMNDQIALETPHTMDPWTVPIDSTGIVARNKLRSMIELSATRMNVCCSQCSRPSAKQAPVGSDDEDEPQEGEQDARSEAARQLDGQEECSLCHGCRAVEMSFVITVTLRVASFLPLALPCGHLAGTKEDHLRYQDNTTDRDEFLRSCAIDGAINAAQRVGKQHYGQHRARLLLASAVVRRTRGVSISVHSHKAKSTRTFDAIDAWPVVKPAPGCDPLAPAYATDPKGSVLDTSLLGARARAQTFLHANLGSPSGLSTSSTTGTTTVSRAAGSYFPPVPLSGTHLSTKLHSLRSRTRSRSRGSPSVRSNPASPSPGSGGGGGSTIGSAGSASVPSVAGGPGVLCGPANPRGVGQGTTTTTPTPTTMAGKTLPPTPGQLAPPAPTTNGGGTSPRRALRDLFAR